MGDFGEVGYGQMMKVDFWTRAIQRYKPGFGYTLIRGRSGGVVKARIHGDPLGDPSGSSSLRTSEHTSFNEFFKTMHHLSIYYQVGTPWSKPIGPPPAWLAPRGRTFWWDVSENPDRYTGKQRRWIERYGPNLTIQMTRSDGSRELKETCAQLLWIDAVRGDPFRSIPAEITMQPFHYLPVAKQEDDLVRQRVNVSWNHSMYHYIEMQLMSPDVARQKLAAVNHELHKALMKAFFGGGGGIVKVSGLGAEIADLIKMGHDLWSWHQDYSKQENEALRDWYRKYMSKQ